MSLTKTSTWFLKSLPGFGHGFHEIMQRVTYKRSVSSGVVCRAKKGHLRVEPGKVTGGPDVASSTE